jgi:hypothetical protein
MEDWKAGRSRGAVIVTAGVYTLHTLGPHLHLAFISLLVLLVRLSVGYIIHCTKNSETAQSGQAK